MEGDPIPSKRYVGKLNVEAFPCTAGEYEDNTKSNLQNRISTSEQGYHVRNLDTGYVSWLPKAVFEKIYSPAPVLPASDVIGKLTDGETEPSKLIIE